MRAVNMKKQNSRYGVGTSVYLVYNINEKYSVHEDMMAIHRVSEDDGGYHYSLRTKHDDPIDWCYEKDVFASHVEAVVEAARRNSLLEE